MIFATSSDCWLFEIELESFMAFEESFISTIMINIPIYLNVYFAATLTDSQYYIAILFECDKSFDCKVYFNPNETQTSLGRQNPRYQRPYFVDWPLLNGHTQLITPSQFKFTQNSTEHIDNKDEKHFTDISLEKITIVGITSYRAAAANVIFSRFMSSFTENAFDYSASEVSELDSNDEMNDITLSLAANEDDRINVNKSNNQTQTQTIFEEDQKIGDSEEAEDALIENATRARATTIIITNE